MSLIPLQIPPGVSNNGTDFENQGRWVDSNLVRWESHSLRPVGGWRDRATAAFAAPARAMLVWEDNSGDRYTAAGTYNKLYSINAGGTVSDITPAGLTAGDEDALLYTGYGGGFYGTGFYGAPRPATGTYSEATTWSLDTWGEYLVACSVADGKLYEWQLVGATPAAQIANSPTSCLGLVVTNERFLMALGADGNPRRVKWCDQEDNTDWTATDINQAGEYDLQTNGQIMQGLQTSGLTLILTDTDAHSASYVGSGFVYGFDRVGTSCGAVSRRCGVAVDDRVYWMGPRGFFMYNAGEVVPVPCEVSDSVFGNISDNQISKTWAVTNNQFNEIWWFYVSEDSTEIDKYVAYNYLTGAWHVGSLARTAGVDRGVFRYPFMANTDGDLVEHEVGNNYDGAEVYAETGPLVFGQGGNQIAYVHRVISDEDTQGDVDLTFKCRFHPNDDDIAYGPFTPTYPINTRFGGRQIRMRVSGDVLTNWRSGIQRLDVTLGGGR